MPTALEGANKAEAETLLGELDDAELLDMGERFERLGHVGVAALELLLVRYSSMLADPLVQRVEGDAQFDWRQNIDRLAQAIAALRTQLACEEGIPANTAQEQVLGRAAALSSPVPTISPGLYSVENTRLMSRRGSSRF